MHMPVTRPGQREVLERVFRALLDPLGLASRGVASDVANIANGVAPPVPRAPAARPGASAGGRARGAGADRRRPSSPPGGSQPGNISV